MKYFTDDFQAFRDGTLKALKYKMSQHPEVNDYLTQMQVHQLKINKLKEVQELSNQDNPTDE